MAEFGTSPTKPHERNFAALTHIASIFFPIIGPAIAYSFFRTKSKFVSFHALTALFDALILKATLLIAGLISLGFTIAKISEHIRVNGTEFSWDIVWPILIKMGITWAIIAILGFVLSIQSIFQAIAAHQGMWKGGAISGRMAHKLLGAEPPSAIDSRIT